jgi:hypothetical protein
LFLVSTKNTFRFHQVGRILLTKIMHFGIFTEET